MMTNNARYFLSAHRAYRSEIALYRHECITAEDCMVVQAQLGAHTLYVVEGRRGEVSVAADLGRAWRAFRRTCALELHSIAVVD